MRTLNLLSLGASCFLAGVATFQQGASETMPTFNDNPAWRVDCEDMQTIRPHDKAVWQAVQKVEMTLDEAVQKAVLFTKEQQGYENIRATRAQLVLATPNYYEVELYTWKEKEDKGSARRWKLNVNPKSRKITKWMLQERLPGVPARGDLIEHPSGLLYFDIAEGDGAEVGPDSKVRVHYGTSLLDGTVVFDTYYSRSPQTFRLSDAPVAGISEGMIGARAGGKRKLILPPELAYGDKGRPDLQVPPGATVIWDIQVLTVDS